LRGFTLWFHEGRQRAPDVRCSWRCWRCWSRHPHGLQRPLVIAHKTFTDDNYFLVLGDLGGHGLVLMAVFASSLPRLQKSPRPSWTASSRFARLRAGVGSKVYGAHRWIACAWCRRCCPPSRQGGVVIYFRLAGEQGSQVRNITYGVSPSPSSSVGTSLIILEPTGHAPSWWVPTRRSSFRRQGRASCTSAAPWWAVWRLFFVLIQTAGSGSSDCSPSWFPGRMPGRRLAHHPRRLHRAGLGRDHGLGWCASRQKSYICPSAHRAIFAIIGVELGLIGTSRDLFFASSTCGDSASPTSARSGFGSLLAWGCPR